MVPGQHSPRRYQVWQNLSESVTPSASFTRERSCHSRTVWTVKDEAQPAGFAFQFRPQLFTLQQNGIDEPVPAKPAVNLNSSAAAGTGQGEPLVEAGRCHIRLLQGRERGRLPRPVSSCGSFECLDLNIALKTDHDATSFVPQRDTHGHQSCSPPVRPRWGAYRAATNGERSLPLYILKYLVHTVDVRCILQQFTLGDVRLRQSSINYCEKYRGGGDS